MILTDFKNKHDGDTIVVCGCGESLKDFRPHENQITIGVNDVGLHFDPTYLLVVNTRSNFRMWERRGFDRFKNIANTRAQVVFTHSAAGLGIDHPCVVEFPLGKQGGTAVVDDRLPFFKDSPYIAVCLAAYMGARRICLIGVDYTMGHFFGNTGAHPLNGRVEEIDKQYGLLGSALKENGVTLMNVSTVSRLKSLPKGIL